jgi:ligand-binding sensor domain-containing protein
LIFRKKKSEQALRYTSGIRCILQDSKGNYWFGSHQEGACRFDGKTFTYFNTENGLSGNQVISIKEDEHGTIWFGTNKGVCNYRDNKINGVVQIESQWAITATDLWFGAGYKVDFVRIENQVVYRLKNPLEPAGKARLDNFGATGFSKGKKGNIWIAYYSGVLGYDGQKFTHVTDSTLGYDGQSMYLHIRSVLEDSKGRLWIGNNGIGVLLKEGDSIVNFTQKLNLGSGSVFKLPSSAGTLLHVFAMKEDKYGNIWFGDRDTGAWRYDGKTMKNFTINASLNSRHIWDIYEDKHGNLLFAMADKGVYKFNGKTFDRVF